MRALAPAWPPNERQSSTATRRPSDAAYTAVDSPAGPAPTTSTSKMPSQTRSSIMPSAVASCVSLGSTSTVPSGVTATASAARGAVLHQQLRGHRVVVAGDHVVRLAVALQEVLQPQHRGRAGRADERRAARAGLDQRRRGAGSARA